MKQLVYLAIFAIPIGCGSGDQIPNPAERTDEDGPLTFDACGFPNDGPWMEVEFEAWGELYTPLWTFSDTPGWGARQWAVGDDLGPRIGITVGWGEVVHVLDDPSGLLVAFDGTMSIRLGLHDLIDHDHTTLCIEGRALSPDTPGAIVISNTWNRCQPEQDALLDASPQVQAVGVDFGTCLVSGDDAQLVRISAPRPLAVQRIHVTLHDAVY